MPDRLTDRAAEGGKEEESEGGRHCKKRRMKRIEAGRGDGGRER